MKNYSIDLSFMFGNRPKTYLLSGSCHLAEQQSTVELLLCSGYTHISPAGYLCSNMVHSCYLPPFPGLKFLSCYLTSCSGLQ